MSKIYIFGSNEQLKVENVYCIGKNYLEHIKEFDKSDVKSEVPGEPIIFLKPNTSVDCNAKSVTIPKYKGKGISNDLQNEVELVIVIGKDGKNIDTEQAYDYILGYTVGIDFTLRDVQSDFKKKGLPWTLSKGFSGAAPISKILLKSDKLDPQNLSIKLTVNSSIKQDSNTKEMIFKIPYLVHYISSIFGLRKGDLIFTGTPAGVTRLNPGDKVKAEIEHIGELNILVE